jgi:hypothetical protein
MNIRLQLGPKLNERRSTVAKLSERVEAEQRAGTTYYAHLSEELRRALRAARVLPAIGEQGLDNLIAYLRSINR